MCIALIYFTSGPTVADSPHYQERQFSL